jgi:serine-type D-Ala-D-Ala carboxypeptidase (penicillin-binding protein 5/6)
VTRYSVLQQAPGGGRGPRRRRGRVWPWFLFALILLGAAVAVPTVLDHATDEGPTSRGSLREVGGGDNSALGGTSAVATAPRGPRELVAYGNAKMEPSRRVRVRFKIPPTAGLLFDLRTGKVLWARHAHKVLSIASLTKMMTALLVVQAEKPNANVRVTKQALAYKGSGVGILPKHKTVPLETLLYGLMLPSGNDAAIALAQKVTHGSVRKFVRRMNRRARNLGLTCTHYSGPDGFDDRGNKSCARDLAVLARQIMHDRRLRKIVGTRKAVRPFPVKGHRIYLYNNNTLMVRGYKGVTGVKTGFTSKAGHCLVATVRRGKVSLGIVLLHSPNTADQGSRLFDAGFRAMHA